MSKRNLPNDTADEAVQATNDNVNATPTSL